MVVLGCGLAKTGVWITVGGTVLNMALIILEKTRADVVLR
jgi:hypothetical protein